MRDHVSHNTLMFMPKSADLYKLNIVHPGCNNSFKVELNGSYPLQAGNDVELNEEAIKQMPEEKANGFRKCLNLLEGWIKRQGYDLPKFVRSIKKNRRYIVQKYQLPVLNQNPSITPPKSRRQ